MGATRIRNAKGQDIPAIIEMVRALHTVTGQPLEFEKEVVRRTLQDLILRPSGLLLVAGDEPDAFIAASVGYASVSSAPVAIEHGWYAAPSAKGAGLRLLILYERWAKEQGCAFCRMCSPPNNESAARLLEKRGFSVSELAWCKAV